MKRALVISSYPAPYRVGVFGELSKEYELDTFFDTCKNEDRNKAWFCKSGKFEFEVLDNPAARSKFTKALTHIRRYDFVLAYDPARKPAILAIVLCRMLGVPYFVNNDGAVIRGNPLKDALKKFLFTGARACFSAGASSTNYFKHYGVGPEKIYLHNFSSLYQSDILTDTIDEEKKSQIKKELKLDNKTTFIAVGQFIRRKGFDVLLEAWQALDGKAQLIIIGGGGERESYERMIERSGYQNVKILDYMDKEALFRYYLASDCFVLPTREDVWGLVVNEAMAVGLPVITTDRCNAGLELIENGVNGYIVPVENAGRLAEKMTEIADNDRMRSAMAKNNIANIQNYTIEGIARSHIDVITKTL